MSFGVHIKLMKHTYASDNSELELKSRGETFHCLPWVVLVLKYVLLM